MTLSPRLLALRDALTVVEESAAAARLEWPCALASQANQHMHWRVRQRQAKGHREEARLRMRMAARSLAPWQGLIVLLTRVAPRPLDSDNLAGALKHVRDGVADALGVNDGDARVVWLVDQAQGTPTVRVEVWKPPFSGP